MQNFEFQNDSQFENAYQDLLAQSDFKRLSNKFTVKPFYFKYKELKQFLGGLSWFIQTVTIAVSFMALKTLLSPMMPTEIAIAVTVVALVAIEGLKRLTFKPAVKEFLQFRKIAAFLVFLSMSMLAISLWLTWNGTHDTVFELTEGPTLLKVDSVTAYEKDRIKQINADIAQAKKITWQGKITEKGQKIIDQLTIERAKVQNKLDSKEIDTKTANDKTSSDHLAKTTANATHFKYLTLCLDLILFALLAWLEYYDFRSLTEFSKLKNTTNQGVVNHNASTTQQGQNHNAMRNDNTTQCVVNNALRNDEFDIPFSDNNAGRVVVKGFVNHNAASIQNTTQSVMNSQRNQSKKRIIKGEVIIVKKACENCGQTFERKTTFQKYCTEGCRIRAWEARNGRKVRKTKRKNF